MWFMNESLPASSCLSSGDICTTTGGLAQPMPCMQWVRIFGHKIHACLNCMPTRPQWQGHVLLQSSHPCPPCRAPAVHPQVAALAAGPPVEAASGGPGGDPCQDPRIKPTCQANGRRLLVSQGSWREGAVDLMAVDCAAVEGAAPSCESEEQVRMLLANKVRGQG